MMKILYRLLAFLLFVVFFGFALKNTDEVVLHLYFNYQTKSPLILMLLAFLLAGAVLGVLAMTTTILRYRRELSRVKSTLAQQQKAVEAAALARSQPPLPDSVIEQAGL
jgi:uncharacterized integral membrane protein